MRKRDKLKQKLGLDRPLSREAPRSPGVGPSGIELASSSPLNTVPLSSAPSAAVGSNTENAGSAPLNTKVSGITDSCTGSSTREPRDMSGERAGAPTSSSTDPGIDTSSPLAPFDPAGHIGTSQPTLPSSTNIHPARDLWKDALQKLASEDREAIERLKPSTNAVQPLTHTIRELLSLTRNVQDECKAKSYKFRFREKDIIVRDVASKIVFWLNKFKEVGDVAVNFDPVHASLPWAGARFLLQVC
jgi:hypothetical protein